MFCKRKQNKDSPWELKHEKNAEVGFLFTLSSQQLRGKLKKNVLDLKELLTVYENWTE